LKILLTGGTGFIGSHLARELLNRGHAVRASVRAGSDRGRVADAASRLEWVTCDLWSASLDELTRLCDSAELCIHAAWYAVPGKYLEAKENLQCLEGSLRLLEAAGSAGCRRVAFLGSCFEYDFTPGYLSEESPVGPQSLYAAAKASTRFLGEKLAKLSGVQFVWPRLFYQYGPFEDSRRLVPHVIQTLMRGERVDVTRGLQVRDFLHVSDVAGAVASIALSQLDGVVNVGSGQPVTVRQVVSAIESALGRQGLVNYGGRPDNPTDPPFVCANIGKLVSGTGWSPAFDLKQGIEQTIEWSARQAQVR
jgi:nucleoside-diphosphate-sugar epimerase